MKNEELLAKVKKEGINSLSPYELQRLGNDLFKKEIFTVNGLIKYAQSGSNIFLNEMLKRYNFELKMITVSWFLKNVKKESLVNKKGEKKEFLNFWLVIGTVRQYGESIKAIAQSGTAQKVKQIESVNIVEEAKKEAEKTAFIVEQNKKRNNERKAAKSAAA